MEVKPITEIIGYRIVGTGIFCIYGVKYLNDSIIEVIQDYMKDMQANESIVDVYNNNIDIHYCGESDLNYIDDYSSETIKFFSSFEEFKDYKDLNNINIMKLREHSNGYVSKIIY